MKKSLIIPAIIACLFVGACKSRHSGATPNVLLITVDSLRQDCLGYMKISQIETPVMDRLAGRGALFEQVMTSSTVTRPSISSIFTGLYPPQHSVRDDTMDRLPSGAHTLAEYFKENGYATAAVIGTNSLGSGSGLEQGFDYYDDSLIEKYPEDRLKAGRIETGGIAAKVNERALVWLQETSSKKKPWFLWVHYNETNYPYTSPSPFSLVYLGDPYAGNVSYIDANIGILTEELRKLNADANTLIVLTSAHGESLGEHQEITHGWQTYTPTSTVFSIFTWPKAIAGGKRITQPVRTIDIFAAILDFAGISVKGKNPSQSLKPLITGVKAVSTWPAGYTEAMLFNKEFKWYPVYSLRDGNFHYIQAKEGELYDLQNDSGEEKNLAGSKPDEAARLAAHLAEIRKSMEKGPKLKRELSKYGQKELDRKLAVGKVVIIEEFSAEPGPNARNMGIDQARELMKLSLEAYELILQAKFSEAIPIYLKIKEKDPDAVSILFYLGKCYLQTGKYNEALSYFHEYTMRVPDTAKAVGMTEEANAWLAKEDTKRAEKILKNAIALDYFYPLAHATLGIAYSQQMLFDDAEKEFDEALKQDPKFAMAYYGRGLIYSSDARRQQAAFEQYSLALENNPGLAKAHLAIGLMLGENTKLKNIDAAIFHLKKALEIDPKLGVSGNAKKALEDLEKEKLKKIEKK